MKEILSHKEILSNLQHIAEVFTEDKLTLTTAESCTGGGLAFEFTRLPGSSAWFNQGWVTYSNEAKVSALGVSQDALGSGAVSEACATEMAMGARKAAHADFAISITGIAGPDGGTESKPVGTVWIGFASHERAHAFCFHFTGDRHQIREQAIQAAILGVVLWLDDSLAHIYFEESNLPVKKHSHF